MGGVLYALRDALAPFALAFTLFLAIDGFARWIKSKVPFVPFGVALVVALAVILGSGFAVIAVLARNITMMAESAGLFQARLEAIAHQIKHALGVGGLLNGAGANAHRPQTQLRIIGPVIVA
jgi:predicted PurR-regulated permease PerM